MIQLKNSDNTPVAEYQPTYEVASGLGVKSNRCTKSDGNGVAVCVLNATQPGVKKIRLTNAKAGLTHEVRFDQFNLKSQALELVSGSHLKETTNGGYRVQVAAGVAFQGIRISTNGGYKGTLSVQGMMLPR